MITESYRINMVGCTDAILQEVGCKEASRKDVALSYAMAIKSQADGADSPDWGKINRAILDRWSMSALEFIKKRAIDLLRGKVKV